MRELIGAIQNIDLRLLHDLNALSGNRTVDAIISSIQDSNLTQGMAIFTVYWFYWLRKSPGSQERIRTTLLSGIIACLIAIIVARLFANLLPFRLRPLSDPASGFKPFWTNPPSDFEGWSAFPSDTAAYIFALSFSLLTVARGPAIFLLAYSAVISVMRVYVGIHYPSDVIVGALIGILASWTTVNWMTKSEITSDLLKRVINYSNVKPEIFYPLAFIISCEMSVVFDDVRAFGRVFAEIMHEHGVRNSRVIVMFGSLSLVVALAIVGWINLLHKHRIKKSLSASP